MFVNNKISNSYMDIIKILLKCDWNIIFAGPSWVGKSIIIKNIKKYE